MSSIVVFLPTFIAFVVKCLYMTSFCILLWQPDICHLIFSIVNSFNVVCKVGLMLFLIRVCFMRSCICKYVITWMKHCVITRYCVLIWLCISHQLEALCWPEWCPLLARGNARLGELNPVCWQRWEMGCEVSKAVAALAWRFEGRGFNIHRSPMLDSAFTH